MKMKAEDLLDYEIDVDGLRRDMKEEYVAAMCCGFPMAVVDLTEVERMSDRELVEQALKNCVDLRMYRV